MKNRQLKESVSLRQNVISVIFLPLLVLLPQLLPAQNTPYYSITNGNWGTPSTWSNISHSGAPSSTAPGSGCNVFIGDGSGYNHTVTLAAGNARCDSLTLSAGSTLDLVSFTGNNFGVVTTNSQGKLRITTGASTAEFPAGTFTAFLGNTGGEVEYYSTAKKFTLPIITASPTSASINSYNYLTLTLAAGKNISMGNSNLAIWHDMTIQSENASTSCELNNAAVSSLTIHDDLLINSGSLLFMNWNSYVMTMIVDSNLIIAPGGTFTVDNNGSGADNTLTIGGNLVNNGTFDMSAEQAFRAYPVIFTGSSNNSISGSGATTDFFALQVDKGNSASSVLDITSSAFTFSNNDNPLTLVNGTFRLSSVLNVTVAADTFRVPSTCRLSANGGTISISPAGTNEDDVFLYGTLEVLNGIIKTGDSTLNFNNDIIYSTSGTPAVVCSGGKLFVNGQIRRSASMGAGSLSYSQSGTSAVTIFGKNAQSGYAQLEVVNSGSSFNMSGGTLIIVKGLSTTVSDVLITPSASNVSGGTLIFGTSATGTTNQSNTFTLESAVPLYNITVTGTNDPKTVTQQTYAHTLGGNLLIQPTSSFLANSLDLNISGNLTNLNSSATAGTASGGYQPGSVTQTTTFEGISSNQTINGVAGNLTNFGNLSISNTSADGKVTIVPNTAIRILGDLTIDAAGTMEASGSDTLTVCGQWTNNGNFLHSDFITRFDGTTLVTGSSVTTFHDALITGSHTLTGPPSGTMQIDNDFTNNGTFQHNSGTLAFTGIIQEITGASSNLFNNLTIASSSNTTMVTAGQELIGVLLCNGTLNADEKLTLLSMVSQTALIDGAGEGEVNGTITMQRYLPSGFGYKYFSSPFQDATVAAFSDDMDLTASFPTFYTYLEEDTASGWDIYTEIGNPLVPLRGYAVNFGPLPEAKTVDISGAVSNGQQSAVTLYNNNESFTLGFNLLGNPYPSPIDWDANEGWTKTNIDNALYYFNAGITNQYTGTYSSYVNGISSDGIADNIIASMQGFFIHVSDGTYPVTGSIQANNQIRTNNLSPIFHKFQPVSESSFIRIATCYGSYQNQRDPVVIRFTDSSGFEFDNFDDALKLMNTDPAVPNFYALTPSLLRLSIQSVAPMVAESLIRIPLGIDTKSEGIVLFELTDYSPDLIGLYLYLHDEARGIYHQLTNNQKYLVSLEARSHDNRFSLVISKTELRYTPGDDVPFYAYALSNRLYLYVDLGVYRQGTIVLHNLMGQKMFEQSVYENGQYEYTLDISPAMYVVTLHTEGFKESKKVIISSR